MNRIFLALGLSLLPISTAYAVGPFQSRECHTFHDRGPIRDAQGNLNISASASENLFFVQPLSVNNTV